MLLTFAILIVSIYALAGPIPDTGQTKCYDDTKEIPCPQPGEPFYGQDGNYIINPPSYTKLDAQGNDLPDSATEWVMVRDNVTGLIWEVKTDDGSVHDKDNRYTWYDSNDETSSGTPGDGTDTEDFIRALNESSFGGFSDWRLPTFEELISIVDYQNRTPAINESYFSNTISGSYFSSSSNSLSNVWIVDFSYLIHDNVSKFENYNVRAVRGGHSKLFDHLIKNGDGTITDAQTGLMWQTQIYNSKLNWEGSLLYFENLKFAGFTDWRLPNKEEIISIFDYSNNCPKFSTEYFNDTLPEFYWSSTSNVRGSGTIVMNEYTIGAYAKSLCFKFNDGSSTINHKSSYYYTRSVRGGQCQISDHLYILFPKQASILNIGSNQTITWATKEIIGNVQISLSRQGGKEGTYEIITESTENDGNFEWIVNGPESFNCALKIEPLDEPLKGNIQSLFSICDPKAIYINAQQHFIPDKYSLFLYGFYTDAPFPIETNWHCDAPHTIKNNVLTGKQNGWVEVSTTYNKKTYKKWLCVYTSLENIEIEANNTIDKATPIDNENFYRAAFYQGDTDYFLINLSTDSIISLGYMSFSYNADMRLSVYDSNNKLMASNISSNGEASYFSLGLSTGKYYLKCESAGDVDEKSYYVVSYKIIEELPSTQTVQLEVNQQEQAVINNLEDQSEFSFTLDKKTGRKILFTASGYLSKYHIELLNENQTVVDQINYLIPHPVELEGIYPAGNYIIRVTPIETVDVTSPFTLELKETNNQLELEPNNTCLQSTNFNTDQPMKGRLSSDADIDFYTFQLDTPRYLEMTVSSFNHHLNVFIYKDSEQNQIGSIKLFDKEEISQHMGLGVGKYFLKVTGIEENNYYYTINIQSSNQTNIEIEPNNNIKFANAIAKDSFKKGLVYSLEDIDYYGFYLPNRSLFSINFRSFSKTADHKLSLLDSNDQIIDLRHLPDGSRGIIDAYQYPGNYYVKIENNGTVDQYNGYTLNISSDAAIEGLKQVVSLVISGDTDEMQISDTKDLTVTVGYSDASSEIITNPEWQSLNEAVASVNADGVVTAIGEGNTSIIAVYSGLVAKFDIFVGAPAHIVKQHHGNLILVAGGGIEDSNTLKESTQYLCDMTYSRFKERLFTDDDIYYFNPMPWHDLDGDGYGENIVDNVNPTLNDFGNAITEWAPSQSTDGPLFIYLIDHGEIDNFKIFPFQILSASDLNTFLNTFQEKTNRKVVLMIEACKSGSFIDDIENSTNRVIITSTGNKNAYLEMNGRISFTQFLMDNLYSGSSLNKAFMFAKNQIQRMGLPYSRMEPNLPITMFPLAETIHIGGNFAIADLSPEILEISPSQTVTANEPHTFYVKMAGMVGIQRVWAVVIPPGYTPPEISHDFEAPEVHLPMFDLSASDQENHFEGVYDKFQYNDIYRIIFYASNEKGNVSVSQMIEVTVQGGSALDSDGDGMPNDWENLYSDLNKDVKDGSEDPDQDGLTNLQEYLHSANPTDCDTDHDNMPDGWEVNWGFNPLENDGDLDADEDGVSNAIEFQDQTNPISNSSFLDHILPKVISTTPALGDVNIQQDTFINIEFSEPMNADLLSSNHILINGNITSLFQAKLSYDTVRHVLTIIPEKYFDFGETVTVKLKNTLTDIAGNPLDGNGNGQIDTVPTDDYTWSFEIVKSPEIVPPNPYDSNEDWAISDFELLYAIDEWAINRMLEQMKNDCDIDFYLLNLIDLWKGGLYGYDQENWEGCFPWRLVE
jgi:hypothetical protein